MQRHTPLRDDILYILSYMSIHDLTCPANSIAKMIYKHSGRYRDLESARKNIARELRRLREKGLVSQVNQVFFGSARKEWVLTDKGIRFILEGRQKGASSIALPARARGGRKYLNQYMRDGGKRREIIPLLVLKPV